MSINQPGKAKPAVKSSQVWANIGIAAGAGALAAVSPEISKALASHPVLAIAGVSVVNLLWRVFITKEPIEGILKVK